MFSILSNAAKAPLLNRSVCAVALMVALGTSGCGDSGGRSGSSGDHATTLKVVPGATSLTTAQPLAVAVSVMTGNVPEASGYVTLTSGAFNSGAVAVTGGTATIDVPAGVLSAGTDALNVAYNGDGNSNATGAASVMVTNGAAPSVAATAEAINLPEAHVFNVLPVGTMAFASVSGENVANAAKDGVRVYSLTADSKLSFACKQAISHIANNTNQVSMISASPDGKTVALAFGDAGIDFLRLCNTRSGNSFGRAALSWCRGMPRHQLPIFGIPWSCNTTVEKSNGHWARYSDRGGAGTVDRAGPRRHRDGVRAHLRDGNAD